MSNFIWFFIGAFFGFVAGAATVFLRIGTLVIQLRAKGINSIPLD